MGSRYDWRALGFAAPPEQRVATGDGPVLYRAWGGTSGEFGSGFFSLEKPSSVFDAEMRFNIADWGNAVHFVSTFKLLRGFDYLVGPVAHGQQDLSRPGTQVWVPSPVQTKVSLIKSRELLRHDVTVIQNQKLESTTH